MGKKGFTLVEVLVVVVLIATLSMIAFPSYKKSREVSANEAARIKLLEVANAARMYNEEVTQRYIAGSFGTPLSSNYVDPCFLFEGTATSTDSKFAYLKNRSSWDCSSEGCGANGCNLRYKGYKFYVCNPAGGDQPIDTCDDNGDLKIAVMEKEGASGRYAGQAWVSTENLGATGNNYDMSLDVEI